MKPYVVCILISSVAIAFVVGFGAGALLTRPTIGEKEAKIETLQANLTALEQSSQQQLQKALAENKILKGKLQTQSFQLNNAEAELSTTQRQQAEIKAKKKVEETKARMTREKILAKRLSYLHEVIEVQWFNIEDNNVYIGFKPLPSDWQIITNAAALHGNKAINFVCNTWAVNADNPNWRPGNGPFYGKATARNGRVQ